MAAQHIPLRAWAAALAAGAPRSPTRTISPGSVRRLPLPPGGYGTAALAGSTARANNLEVSLQDAERLYHSHQKQLLVTGICHTNSSGKKPCHVWTFLTYGLLTVRARSLCSRLLCKHASGWQCEHQRFQRYLGAGVGSTGGIPFPANWKRQQLVMQSISRGRSLQLPALPPSQGKAGRKPDHPFQPTGKPAVPGTPWEAVSAEGPFHEDLPAHRQEELATLPSDTPRSGRSRSGQAANSIHCSNCD